VKQCRFFLGTDKIFRPRYALYLAPPGECNDTAWCCPLSALCLFARRAASLAFTCPGGHTHTHSSVVVVVVVVYWKWKINTLRSPCRQLYTEVATFSRLCSIVHLTPRTVVDIYCIHACYRLHYIYTVLSTADWQSHGSRAACFQYENNVHCVSKKHVTTFFAITGTMNVRL